VIESMLFPVSYHQSRVPSPDACWTRYLCSLRRSLGRFFPYHFESAQDEQLRITIICARRRPGPLDANLGFMKGTVACRDFVRLFMLFRSSTCNQLSALDLIYFSNAFCSHAHYRSISTAQRVDGRHCIALTDRYRARWRSSLLVL